MADDAQTGGIHHLLTEMLILAAAAATSGTV